MTFMTHLAATRILDLDDKRLTPEQVAQVEKHWEKHLPPYNYKRPMTNYYTDIGLLPLPRQFSVAAVLRRRKETPRPFQFSASNIVVPEEQHPVFVVRGKTFKLVPQLCHFCAQRGVHKAVFLSTVSANSTKFHDSCPQHTKEIYHLTLKPSLIKSAGTGLFAHDPSKQATKTPVFKAGEKICNYGGMVTDLEELAETFGNLPVFPYAIKISASTVVDASLDRGLGAMINDPVHKRNANARFVINTNLKIVNVEATKNIRHGDEIYVSYGTTYWDGDHDAHKTLRTETELSEY